jgi:hypothetical protein
MSKTFGLTKIEMLLSKTLSKKTGFFVGRKCLKHFLLLINETCKQKVVVIKFVESTCWKCC